jgi:hypothetical protein
MRSSDGGIPLDEMYNAPRLSLTTVQWITEIQDEEDEDCYHEVTMFDVVGEQHRLPLVSAAAIAICEESSYQPARFWLMPDDQNEHDDQAVAAYATALGRAYHVGFLPQRQARLYRESMSQLGRTGESLEVLGCITHGKSSPHPNARLYLPVDFVSHILNGYLDNPQNYPAWLQDLTPVPKRPPSRRAEAFTDIELCKIYCLYAKQKLWNNFPDEVEGRAAGFRASGLGSAGEVLSLYYDDGDRSPGDRASDALGVDEDEEDVEDDEVLDDDEFVEDDDDDDDLYYEIPDQSR